MTNILVAGGAGYIGAHTCLDLSNKGFIPIVYDNLSNGHAEFVKWGPLEIGDIRDRNKLDKVLSKYKPVAIVHFAAVIEVGESVRDPGAYYDNNVSGNHNVAPSGAGRGHRQNCFLLDLRHLRDPFINTGERVPRLAPDQPLRSKQTDR
jgi:UDP-glucose 4-epimerase